MKSLTDLLEALRGLLTGHAQPVPVPVPIPVRVADARRRRRR